MKAGDFDASKVDVSLVDFEILNFQSSAIPISPNSIPSKLDHQALSCNACKQGQFSFEFQKFDSVEMRLFSSSNNSNSMFEVQKRGCEEMCSTSNVYITEGGVDLTGDDVYQTKVVSCYHLPKCICQPQNEVKRDGR
jgi:hypothetical protein